MKIIGLTGGIASGKSTVSKMLKDLGAIIIDADEIAREVTQKGKAAYMDIINYFGKEILLESGDINRKKLANIVFGDTSALKKLNDITHSRIFKIIEDKINFYKKNQVNGVIILDVALLIETDLKHMVDEIWLITIDKDIQKSRLIKRNNLSMDEVNKRISAQMPLEEKIQYADYLIDNSGDIKDLKVQVEKLWEMINKK